MLTGLLRPISFCISEEGDLCDVYSTTLLFSSSDFHVLMESYNVYLGVCVRGAKLTASELAALVIRIQESLIS